MTDGDVLIRPLDSKYLVLDAASRSVLDGPFDLFAEALDAALGFVKPGHNIWQENVDNRGREIGPPTRLF